MNISKPHSNCTACTKNFANIGSFTAHQENGSCLSTIAMINKGMKINIKGHWELEGVNDVNVSRPTFA